MIRPLTLVSLLVAAGAGLHLYQVKHSVSLLDRELREVNREKKLKLTIPNHQGLGKTSRRSISHSLTKITAGHSQHTAFVQCCHCTPTLQNESKPIALFPHQS